METVPNPQYGKIVAVINAMKAMEEAGASEGRFMLCRVQCKEMIFEFSHLGDRIESIDKDDKSFPSLTELHRITLTARKLLRSCCFEDATSWLRAALTQDDMEVFEIVRNNLKIGFQIFAEVRRLPPLQYPRRLRDRKSVFEDDQVEFRNQLLQMLEIEPNTLPDEQVRSIATFLLRRLINEENTILFADSIAPPDFWFNRPGKRLGQGAYGVVEAIRFFGIKMASKTFFDTSNSLGACVNEGLVMAKLKHPNVVRFISCSIGDRRGDRPAAIIMECVELTRGSDEHPLTLEDYLDPKRGLVQAPLDLLIAVDIMYQISLGMEHLHSRGVAHLDLKPSNILLALCEIEEFPGYVHLKIADLGVSMTDIEDGFLVRNSDPRRGATLFRAPELFREGEFVNMKKADVYGFALICWQIVHGKERLLADVEKKSKYHEEVFKGRRLSIDPNVCHPYLKKLIEECWHRNPNRRPSFSDCSFALLSFKAQLLGSGASQIDFNPSTERRESWITRFWRMIFKSPRRQRICPPPLENPLESLIQRIADSSIEISELRSKWRSQAQNEGSSSSVHILGFFFFCIFQHGGFMMMLGLI